MADLNITVDMVEVQRLRQELEQLATRAGVAQGALDNVTPTTNRLASAAQYSSRGMNQMGVATQQAGYQIGDFLVQVQSGTNWMVAFGQQATQLVGILPMFNPGLVGLAAGLGIAIPLATALGAAFMRTSGTAETFTKSLEALNKQLSESNDLSKIIAGDMDFLAEKFGGLSVEVYNLVAAQGEVQLRALADAASALNAELTAMYNGNAWLNVSRAEDLGNGLDLGYKSARELAIALEDLKNQDTLSGQIQKTTQLKETFLGMVGSVGDMTSAQFEFYSRIVDSEAALRATANRAEEMSGAAARVALEASGILNKVEGVKTSLASADGKQLQLAFASAFPVANQLLSLAQKIVSTIGTMGPSDQGVGMGRGNSPGGPLIGSADLAVLQAGGGVWRNLPDKEPGGGGGGGGGGGNARLESLISELQTESETLAIWYEESQAALQAASDAELTILGGKHDAMLRLKEEYMKRSSEIDEMANQSSLSIALGGAAEIAGALGAFNKKALKAQAVFAAGSALIDTYKGAAKALGEGGIKGFAAAAAVIAKGLSFVAAIKSAGEGSTSVSAGGGGRGTSTVPQAAAAPSPQRVYIDSLDPDGLYSGQALINLFDALYDENDRRGKVFVVGR
jgi:hypothetical protein